MGSGLFEESLDVEIGLVEAQNPTLDKPAGYPLPFLLPATRFERRTFHAWVLENDYLKVSVLPELGGRIASLFDKRSSKQILPPCERWVCRSGGPRGAYLDAGIQLRLNGVDRLQSLGPVQAQPEEEDDGAARLWLGDIEPVSNVGFHLIMTLPEGEAAVSIEARVFNRSLRPVSYWPSISAHVLEGDFLKRPGSASVYSRESDQGLALLAASEPMDFAAYENGRLEFGRFREPQVLAPRQTDQWSVKIVPISGLGRLDAITATLSLGVGSELRLQTVKESEAAAKIFLQTSNGETHQASVALAPDRPVAIPLSGDLASPAGILVRSAAGDTLVEWREGEGTSETVNTPLPTIDWPTDLPPEGWQRLTFSPAIRPLAHLQLAIDALGAGAWASAYSRFESALLFNADDPLAWWGKAVARRLLAEDEGEGGENADLLNSHFLAPLDPILRIESFLSQPQGLDKEANPLLRGLGPDLFADAACLLLEHRLVEEAVRVLDEGLRHQDVATLRYLLAYCHLIGSGLRAEAGQQVSFAAQILDGPPYPWRPIEKKALARLREDFPGDEALARRASLLDHYLAETDDW